MRDDKADVRFFSREASNMLEILFANISEKDSKDDYYSIMKEDFDERQEESKKILKKPIEIQQEVKKNMNI